LERPDYDPEFPPYVGVYHVTVDDYLDTERDKELPLDARRKRKEEKREQGLYDGEKAYRADQNVRRKIYIKKGHHLIRYVLSGHLSIGRFIISSSQTRDSEHNSDGSAIHRCHLSSFELSCLPAHSKITTLKLSKIQSWSAYVDIPRIY
jgi:hypothetical protein